MNSSSSTTDDLREELRGDAQKIGDAAAERLQSEADARKGAAAGQAKSLSSALEKVAGEMGAETPSWLKSALGQGADALGRLAETVDQQDSRQLMGSVKSFARSNPGAFLAGCAALGFAAARVLKAGEDDIGGAAGVARAPSAPSYRPSNAADAAAEDSGAANRPAVPLAPGVSESDVAAATTRFPG
jgi:hypothetical protein